MPIIFNTDLSKILQISQGQCVLFTKKPFSNQAIVQDDYGPYGSITLLIAKTVKPLTKGRFNFSDMPVNEVVTAVAP